MTLGNWVEGQDSNAEIYPQLSCLQYKYAIKETECKITAGHGTSSLPFEAIRWSASRNCFLRPLLMSSNMALVMIFPTRLIIAIGARQCS